MRWVLRVSAALFVAGLIVGMWAGGVEVVEWRDDVQAQLDEAGDRGEVSP